MLVRFGFNADTGIPLRVQKQEQSYSVCILYQLKSLVDVHENMLTILEKKWQKFTILKDCICRLS